MDNTANPQPTQRGFWEFKKYKEHEWFRALIFTLIGIAALYIVLHFVVNKRAGYEYVRLDKKQLEQINRIFFDSLQGQFVETRANTESTQATPLSPGDSADRGRQTPESPGANVPPKNQQVLVSSQVPDSIRCSRAIAYISSEFNDKWDAGQIEQIRPYLCSSGRVEAVAFLGNVRLRVQSYFWLIGPEVYFEIIFWSLFGVIASLLFNLGVVGRARTTNPQDGRTEFDSSEIPYQFAKIWYAPLCTLTIVLGYNYFNDQNIVDISSSKGVIVFAFIGGFYSARLVAFLDRLKEVVLPNSGTVDLPVQGAAAPAMISGVQLELQEDEPGLSPAVKNEIAETGFRSAVVTLENETTGAKVTAKKTGEDQSSLFDVPEIPRGKYVLSATWTNEIDGEVINLRGEQTEEISASGAVIVLKMRKTSADG